MESVAYVWGMIGIALAATALSRVKRLERILRENGIRPGGISNLGEQLRRQVGQLVTLTMETSDGELAGKVCRVLDADECWALVLVNEGKKSESRKLIRLDGVKQIKVK